MGNSDRGVVNPLAAAMLDRVAYAIHANPLVVVAADRKNRCNVAEPANQVTQPRQLGGAVHQVAAEQNHVRFAPQDGIPYLAT
jgi:hypothetical protein